jgi:hypothetical protein
MTPTFIEEAVRVVTETYGAEHVRIATESGKTLVRIDDVELYPTARPPRTTMMLVLDPGQPKPIPYVQQGQLLANGKAPKSTSPVLVGGEPWMQYSFNVPWSEEHGIIRFIAAARQRFAQDV